MDGSSDGLTLGEDETEGCTVGLFDGSFDTDGASLLCIVGLNDVVG